MEVEEGKRHWEGGLGYLREGESSRVCTDLHIAVCSLTGWEGRGGGRDVYVKLCWLCGTASNRKLEKGKNLHVWVWEPVVSGLQRRAPILSGCEVGDITTPFLRFTPRPAHSPSHTLS